MAGFDVGRTYTLSFEGNLEGAEVRIKGTSVGAVLELRATLNDQNFKRIAEILSDHLISWNLQDNGEDIPTTVEGILSLEEVVMSAIVKEWVMAARGVTAPLDPPSEDGEQSEEESIPMETLSENLVS